jgi:hypothetical protein
MTFFKDLTPCNYFGVEFAESLRAVGWLSRNKSFTKGEVSEVFFKRLCELLQNPWNPFYFLGVHECEFCRFTQGFGGDSQFWDYKVARISNKNLFVPAEGFIYVAPESITHYIDAHEYCPPEDFCRAVLDCPEMRSREYLIALLKNGGRGLRQKAKEKFQKPRRTIKQR